MMDQQFANDLMKGLSSKNKYIPSKYFYDDKGSRIFQKIMDMPEYYPTNCEFEILHNNRDQILNYFLKDADKFNLIEFGAGDGQKTKILLKHFYNNSIDFTYMPIDISNDILIHLENEVHKYFPELNIKTINDDYFTALHKLKSTQNTRKNIVLFLGSNIGNFEEHEAINFLRSIRNELNDGDYLFVGFDLKKDPRVILNAYNDKRGITKDFNLNLLQRINREFDADFDLNKFIHFPTYDPITGKTKSYIISLVSQNVKINKLKKEFSFEASEPIYTEISQKYDYKMIDNFAKAAGFEHIAKLNDHRDYFTDVIWEAI